MLVALSAGDQRRQAALDTADHLLSCEYCATLSEPLLQKRRPAGVLLPLAFLHRLKDYVGGWSQTPHAGATAATAGALAVAAVALGANIMLGGNDPASIEGRLTTSGKVLPTSASRLERHVGKRVKAHGIMVESVPSDEGFWIGSNEARVFVRLVIPVREESPVRIEAGERVTFTGTLRRHGPGFARRQGVSKSEGAGELRRSPPHIVISMREIKAR